MNKTLQSLQRGIVMHVNEQNQRYLSNNTFDGIVSAREKQKRERKKRNVM